MKSKNIEIYNILDEMHPKAGCELVHNNPFELIVAVILSAQCTDRRVNIVTEELFKVIKTPEDLVNIDRAKLEEIIHPCGFYHNKAENLQKMGESVVKLFNGQIPNNREDLMKLAAYIIEFADKGLKTLAKWHPIILDDKYIIGLEACVKPFDAVEAHFWKTTAFKRFFYLHLDGVLAAECVDFRRAPIHDKNTRQQTADIEGLKKGNLDFRKLGMDAVVAPEKVGKNSDIYNGSGLERKIAQY